MVQLKVFSSRKGRFYRVSKEITRFCQSPNWRQWTTTTARNDEKETKLMENYPPPEELCDSAGPFSKYLHAVHCTDWIPCHYQGYLCYNYRGCPTVSQGQTMPVQIGIQYYVVMNYHPMICIYELFLLT